jgi:hypothetical protein
MREGSHDRSYRILPGQTHYGVYHSQDTGKLLFLYGILDIFSDIKPDESTLFEISNLIYSPSYVSLESALSYYGLIPEAVFSINSVSTRKTAVFKTPLAVFNYRKIKKSLFFGYILQKYNNKSYKIASPEKAILDYFYHRAEIGKHYDFESLSPSFGKII